MGDRLHMYLQRWGNCLTEYLNPGVVQTRSYRQMVKVVTSEEQYAIQQYTLHTKPTQSTQIAQVNILSPNLDCAAKLPTLTALSRTVDDSNRNGSGR